MASPPVFLHLTGLPGGVTEIQVVNAFEEEKKGSVLSVNVSNQSAYVELNENEGTLSDRTSGRMN